MKKNKKSGLIVGVVTVLLVGAIAAVAFFTRGGAEANPADAAYVAQVAELAGIGTANGMLNRFSGVVESQETWSLEKNPEYTVAEVFVSVGQTVEVETPLFAYDVKQFEQSQAQSQIDLERLEAELASMEATIAQLEKEKKAAPSSDQAAYTIQIQQQQLEKKQKEYDITSKKSEIEKLKENIANATVTSKIAGVVQTINNGNGSQVSYGEMDNSFIKIMKTGDLRVKGTINESNIGEIMEGTEMLIHSRVDPNRTWRGTVTLVDRENGSSNRSYYGDAGAQSTNYPFYVDLETSEDLMLGQHVYMERYAGQDSENENTGIWLDMYYVDESDPGAPFVWVSENGKLAKRPVTLGERDEDLFKVQILEGLAAEDYIAFPDEGNHEGQATLTMEEFMASGEFDGEGYQDAEGEDMMAEEPSDMEAGGQTAGVPIRQPIGVG